jgi:enamine deaminase RidA (YjgF/YER057c/UK114 family)
MYLSGMIPEDTSLDVTGQVKQALGEIDALLKKGGSDKTRILSAVIWLRDIGDFAAMNAVWDSWVVAGQTPARACSGTTACGSAAAPATAGPGAGPAAGNAVRLIAGGAPLQRA